MDVNYIKHLNGVFGQLSRDGRLNPTHISLYVALFQLWNLNFFKEEFHINREEVMALSKIGSKSTYHRCIKELSHWKYILYTPSHNPFRGSKVKMFDFGTTSGQVLYPDRTDMGTGDGQAQVPIIKPVQTLENSTNDDKRQILKNSRSQDFENNDKRTTTVPYRDNLKTTVEKDYNQPL